ncbi:NADH-quinone oxidoreductase subunit A [Candidatus Hodarchaeum mangrovi]
MYDEALTHMGIFLVAGLASPIVIKLIQYLLAPNIPRLRRASTTYECGEKPIGEAQVHYNVQYFTFAVVFVVFDILTVLLVLWAYAFQLFDPVVSGLIIMSVFAFTLLCGLVFWMKKGTLSWV